MTTPLPPAEPSTAAERRPGEAELAALYRQLPRSEPGPALAAVMLQAAAQTLGAVHAVAPAGVTEQRKPSREKLAPRPGTSISFATSPARRSIELVAHARHRRKTAQASVPVLPRIIASVTASPKPAIESQAPATPAPRLREAPPAAQPAEKDSETPAQALDKIRPPFAQGHDAEALQRLRSFQPAFPHWPQQPTLRAQLGQP